MVEVIPDSSKTHWVNRAPENIRPYLQLSRLDRPVGYWLLALPGWIGLAFAGLSHGLFWSDLKWAVLILIGAIAMRGAGCSYNDIVDQDLDARITWFPQVWLGMTFNWAVLVAYAAKTGELSPALFILYLGLIFWTVGYDTIYACQDIEDDAFVGIKSTARRFGGQVKLGVGGMYFLTIILLNSALSPQIFGYTEFPQFGWHSHGNSLPHWLPELILLPLALHLAVQVIMFDASKKEACLKLFKSNAVAAVLLIISVLTMSGYNYFEVCSFMNEFGR